MFEGRFLTSDLDDGDRLTSLTGIGVAANVPRDRAVSFQSDGLTSDTLGTVVGIEQGDLRSCAGVVHIVDAPVSQLVAFNPFCQSLAEVLETTPELAAAAAGFDAAGLLDGLRDRDLALTVLAPTDAALAAGEAIAPGTDFVRCCPLCLHRNARRVRHGQSVHTVPPLVFGKLFLHNVMSLDLARLQL